MLLSTLTLQHFRSYTKKIITFSPWTTLIVGPNASGKTNILEALSFLATGKSFRADRDTEAIRWGEDVGRISAVVDETTLSLVLTNGVINGRCVPAKKYLVNSVSRRLVDFIGHLRIVLFWPEHLELVTDSPSIRRKYLDSVLVQVDREYRRNLLSYERGLRQRNKLLDFINEGKATPGQLLFWNQLLIRAGSYLTQARAGFIDFINQSDVAISSYQLVYDKSVMSELRLAQYREEEIAAKVTLVGPHRDDILFYLRDATHTSRESTSVDLGKYGSRGEQRLAILWLKLAEILFIQSYVGQRPILLLDDIFSELDEAHRALVLDLIGQQQTIVTSADGESVGFVKAKMKGRHDILTLSLE